MRERLSRLLVASAAAAALLIAAAACGDPDPTATPAPTATPEPQLPATNASSVWSFLQEQDYRETWDFWPGKGELYEGTEPHGMLLTTYVNQAALDAINGQAGTMPDGVIIVKENYTPDGTYDSATVMYKVEGYNAEHNDWFWAKIRADDSVEAEGKVEGCQACHSAEQANDYIYTSDLQ